MLTRRRLFFVEGWLKLVKLQNFRRFLPFQRWFPSLHQCKPTNERSHSADEGESTQLRISSRCHQRQPARAFSVTGSSPRSYLQPSIRRALLSVQLCCQQSRDVDGNVTATISPLPLVFYVFHVQTKVAIKPLLRIFTLFLFNFNAPT